MYADCPKSLIRHPRPAGTVRGHLCCMSRSHTCPALARPMALHNSAAQLTPWSRKIKVGAVQGPAIVGLRFLGTGMFCTQPSSLLPPTCPPTSHSPDATATNSKLPRRPSHHTLSIHSYNQKQYMSAPCLSQPSLHLPCASGAPEHTPTPQPSTRTQSPSHVIACLALTLQLLLPRTRVMHAGTAPTALKPCNPARHHQPHSNRA